MLALNFCYGSERFVYFYSKMSRWVFWNKNISKKFEKGSLVEGEDIFNSVESFLHASCIMHFALRFQFIYFIPFLFILYIHEILIQLQWLSNILVFYSCFYYVFFISMHGSVSSIMLFYTFSGNIYCWMWKLLKVNNRSNFVILFYFFNQNQSKIV